MNICVAVPCVMTFVVLWRTAPPRADTLRLDGGTVHAQAGPSRSMSSWTPRLTPPNPRGRVLTARLGVRRAACFHFHFRGFLLGTSSCFTTRFTQCFRFTAAESNAASRLLSSHRIASHRIASHRIASPPAHPRTVRFVDPAAGVSLPEGLAVRRVREPADVVHASTGGSELVEFSAGNPRAEIITGRLHVYRDQTGGASEGARSGGGGGGAGHAPGTSALPEGRCEMLCVHGVPSELSVADFCQFAAALIPKVVEMRMVNAPDAARSSRGGSTYSVVMRFADQDAADSFALNYHDRRFNSFVEGTCRVLFVKAIELVPAGAASSSGGDVGGGASVAGDDAGATGAVNDRGAHNLPAPEGLTELPSCPVCLDRLDQDVSGVVTTICSHSFHAACLSKWGDSSCPVCRYTQRAEDEVHCQVCGSAENLWVCLICGYIGCGRYAHAHAVDHWKETDHCYSLELGTQRVWDYVRDGFVHRLIQSKTGLVELSPGPGQRGRVRGGQSGRSLAAGASAASVRSDASGQNGGLTSSGGDGGLPGEFKFDDGDGSDDAASCRPCRRRNSAAGWLDEGLDEYDPDYPLDPGLEEAIVSSKLDAIHTEYNQLLTSQLDSQRRYFEGLLASAQAEKDGAVSAAVAAEKQAAVIAGAVQDARDARQSLKEAHKKMDEQLAKISKLGEEKEFLKSLNDTLLTNQKDYMSKLKEVEGRSELEIKARDEKISDLEEQVRDLMVFLDAQSKIEKASAEGEVIEGGSVLGVGDGELGPSRGGVHERLQKKMAARKKKGGV